MSASVNQRLPVVDGTHALACSSTKVLPDSLAAQNEAPR
jgi:hypothetical protein